jgi:hypothetical protein
MYCDERSEDQAEATSQTVVGKVVAPARPRDHVCEFLNAQIRINFDCANRTVRKSVVLGLYSQLENIEEFALVL